jgi:hypothetical protein
LSGVSVSNFFDTRHFMERAHLDGLARQLRLDPAAGIQKADEAIPANPYAASHDVQLNAATP